MDFAESIRDANYRQGLSVEISSSEFPVQRAVFVREYRKRKIVIARHAYNFAQRTLES